MNIDIVLLIIVVGGLFALLILLLIYLVIRKQIENRTRERLQTYKEKYRKVFFDYILQGSMSKHLLPQGNRLKLRAIEELLEHCSRLLSGDEAKQRIQDYAKQYFTQLYRVRLRGREWSIRMNTLFRIERFDMRHLESELVEALERQRNLELGETTQILKLLAKWGSYRTIDQLVVNAAELSEFQRRLILSHMNEVLFRRFIHQLNEVGSVWSFIAIDVIGIQRKTAYIDFLNHKLTHNNPEFRIRSLKALSQFSMLHHLERYEQHAYSASWQERMMAAKLFGTFRNARFTPLLQKLLSDDSWWVRSQAAQSLLRERSGVTVLERVAASNESSLAQQTAAEWLERRDANGQLG